MPDRTGQLSDFTTLPRFSLPICAGDRRIVSYCSRGQVAMRRVQFIELHEQPWFPSSLRDEITDALQFGLNLLKAYAPIAPLLQSVLDSTRSRSIVDMCSGGGGPWLDLSRKLQRRRPDSFTFGSRINTQTSGHSKMSDRLLRITLLSIRTRLTR